jgi:hypothetical protein
VPRDTYVLGPSELTALQQCQQGLYRDEYPSANAKGLNGPVFNCVVDRSDVTPQHTRNISASSWPLEVLHFINRHDFSFLRVLEVIRM